jgi:hypothetical protein
VEPERLQARHLVVGSANNENNRVTFESFTAVTIMPSSGMSLVTTDVSDERILSIIRMKRISEIGIAFVPGLMTLFTLVIKVIRSPESSVLTESHGITSLTTAIFTVRIRVLRVLTMVYYKHKLYTHFFAACVGC